MQRKPWLQEGKKLIQIKTIFSNFLWQLNQFNSNIRQLHIQETDTWSLNIAFSYWLQLCSGDATQDSFLGMH